MSWNDICSECGNPRYGCECKIEPYTKKQLDKFEEESEQRLQNKKICNKIGHDWDYTFIIYQCKRCSETSNY